MNNKLLLWYTYAIWWPHQQGLFTLAWHRGTSAYKPATGMKWRIMHELPWITIFCHEWGDSAMIFTSDEVTSENHCRFASRVTKKFVIHGNECIILFLTRYFMSWTHKSAENYHRALISPLLPRVAFSDRALWRHYNWFVTSCEREILVLWRHICLLSLHAQFGTKAIFTSE